MLIGAALAITTPAATTVQSLSELVARHRYAIVSEDDGLGGPGIEFLAEEGARSSFFLIGENHNTQETPRLTAHLARELRRFGYSAFAIEVGPSTARRLATRLIADGVDAYRAEVARHPYTVPFFEGEAEVELLRSVIDAGYAVWGLDQEFVGSGRYWLDRLEAMAPREAARALVAAWQERELAAMQHYLDTGSSEMAFLMNASAADFDELARAFAQVPEAEAVLSELARSAEIYQLYAAGRNYESNHARIRYMKENLIERLHERRPPGPTPPRIMMKFGSVHMGRGYSPLNQLDLGNQAAELAFADGSGSFHLRVTAGSRQSLDGSVSDWWASSPQLQPLYSRLADALWTVFDLRPLRPFFHSERNRAGNEDLARLVFRYDAIAITPRFHEASPLVQERHP